MAFATTYLSDSLFDVVERPIALREDNYRYRELEVETRPQQSWTAVHDSRCGLAVIATGLMETAVRDMPDHPLALTLLRATRRTVGTNGEPGGELLGRHEFNYWLTPLEGSPDRTRLCDLGQRLAAGLPAVQLDAADQARSAGAPGLPERASFLEVHGPAVMTSLRQVDGQTEVRLFNPCEEPIQVTLALAAAAQGARMVPVDFESRPVGPEQWVAAPLTMDPKKIVTLRFL